MHIVCPDCRREFEVPTDDDPPSHCPGCGRKVSPADMATVTFRDFAVRAFGRFRLIERLGEGHFGEVFMARDTDLDRLVAIKLPRKQLLSEPEVERFLREARAAACLNHPHIVRVHEAGRVAGRAYIVSDLVRGVTLAEWLAHTRPTTRQAAEWTAALAEALHHAHEQGVVHRDVKPGNIMLDDRQRPLLMDFGLARRDAGDATLTVEGRMLGTPAYMSPEQARGEGRHADRRSDVYSLGVALYEMLCGGRPFHGQGRLLVHQVLHDQPRSPRQLVPDLPRDLETITLKALEKRPEERYATAGGMAADLRRFLAGEPIQARPVSRSERLWRQARRQPLPAAAAAVIAVLAVLLGLVAWDNIWSTPPPAQPDSDPVAIARRTVHLETDPPGARVAFVPIDDRTGEPRGADAVRPDQGTPLVADLPPGFYLVVAEVKDHGFQEVYRTVPAPTSAQFESPHRSWRDLPVGEVELPPIVIPRLADTVADMAYFAGGRFTMGSNELDGVPPHACQVEAFYLDVTEVTLGQFRTVMGYPAERQSTRDPPPAEDWPIAAFTFDEAVNFAECTGKRLPTEAEYEFAATAGGTCAHPWGEATDLITVCDLGPVRKPAYDHTATDPPVYGLCSNVAEWTDSWPLPYPGEKAAGVSGYGAAVRDSLRSFPPDLMRIVRGVPIGGIAAPASATAARGVSPRARHAEDCRTADGWLGFRCARCARARFLD